jgi:hypothetical protein
MADNFDLKKFLKENKSIENLNPLLKKENLSEGNLRSKIREMILTELGGEDYELEDRKQKYGINPEEDEDYSDYFFDIDTPEEDLEEAKKKKDEEVEDVETTDVETTDTTEEMPAEDAPADEAPADEAPATGGLEDLAANMEGTESELMGHLMDALKIAKGMNN